MTEVLRVFVGRDEREPLSYEVTCRSIRAHASRPLSIVPIGLRLLQGQHLYTRPTERRHGRLWDVISEQPMSTEFSVARFWVPYLCNYEGWALFVDGDFLFRDDIVKLFSLADDGYAVMCVKHHFIPEESTKMDGQIQRRYRRKLWSALMLFNCGHRSCARLDLDYLNNIHRDHLHQFRWCWDSEIGELPQQWHVIESGVSAYHFTKGTLELGIRGSAFDDEWSSYL